MKSSYKFTNDMNSAITLIHQAGTWLQETGKNPSKWWKPENLTKKFLLQYAKPNEFYVLFADGISAAAAILQTTQNSQDWSSIDGDSPKSALYIHWLCVSRTFAGRGVPNQLIQSASELAIKEKIGWIRVDTNAEETKLRKIYERMGFRLVQESDEGYRKTAFYQKSVSINL